MRPTIWVDGANALQQFRHITIPMLTPIIFFNLVLQLIDAFQAFTPSFFTKVTGDPEVGGRYWHLYSGSFAPPNGTTLRFRAHRLGYHASENVALTIGP